MNNKLIAGTIGIVVGIIVLSSVLVPVLNDAETVRTPNKLESNILLKDYAGEEVTVQYIPSSGHYNELIVNGKTFVVDSVGIVLYCDTYTISSRLYNGQIMLDNWNASSAYDTAGYGQEFTVNFTGTQWTSFDKSGSYSELYIINNSGPFCSVNLSGEIYADADSTLVVGRPGSGATSRIITAPTSVAEGSINTTLYTTNTSTWVVSVGESAAITWDVEEADGAIVMSNFTYTGSTSVDTSGLYAVLPQVYYQVETASYAGLLNTIPVLIIVALLGLAIGFVATRER